MQIGSSISTYRVTLDVFEGPLDLLLRLIEREELDISRISLTLVADQYLAYVAQLSETSAANLADFLVVAAKLLLIKSRALLPKMEEEEQEEDKDEVGEELEHQLREYKRFKEAAKALRQIEERGLKAYPRIAAPVQLQQRLEPGSVTLADLVEACKRALEAHPVAQPVDRVVAPIVVHIADCIKTITELLHRHRRLRFSTLVRRARSRLEIIVSFLALLELLKQQRLVAVQERAFGEIYIEPRVPDSEADLLPLDLSEYGEEGSLA